MLTTPVACGIESLAKRRKDLRFKYYLNVIDKNLTLSLIFNLVVLRSAITLGSRVAYLYLPSGQMHFLFVLAKNVARL